MEFIKISKLKKELDIISYRFEQKYMATSRSVHTHLLMKPFTVLPQHILIELLYEKTNNLGSYWEIADWLLGNSDCLLGNSCSLGLRYVF